MVIGSLKNTARFEGLNPYFKMVFDYVKSHDLSNAEPGRIVLDGDNAYINIAHVDGKDKSAAVLETHNEYIDVQILLSGEETFAWRPRVALVKEKGEYSVQDDISFYADDVKLYFTLSVGEFAIFFPEDGHAPCIGNGKIKKLIAKVRV